MLILALIAIDAIFSGLWGLSQNPVRNLIDYYLLPTNVLSQDIAWRALWVAVLLLVILYWVLSLAIWRKRPRAIQVRTSGGETMLIHPGALLKFVRLQVENHPAVVSQRVKVRQKGSRGLSVWAMVNVQPIDSLPTIKRQLESSIRDGFAQVMGIEKIDDVTIVIGLDEKSLTRRPGPGARPEPKPEPPVRGAIEEEEPTYDMGEARKWEPTSTNEIRRAEDTEKI
jgi:hypothetical protein